MGGNKSGRAPVNHTAIHHRGRAIRVNDPFTVGARVLRRALGQLERRRRIALCEAAHCPFLSQLFRESAAQRV
jgi:hypothetical protein